MRKIIEQEDALYFMHSINNPSMLKVTYIQLNLVSVMKRRPKQ